MPYIEALAGMPEIEQVTVVAPCETLHERTSLGWSSPAAASAGNLSVLVAPADRQVEALLQTTDVALFSGITAFPQLKSWLDMSMRFPVRRGCITEAPLTCSLDDGIPKPLWLHRLRFLLKDYRYARHFDRLFAIGPDAISYYRSWSLPWKVVPFLYCTRFIDTQDESQTFDGPIRILFVGELSRRKDVMTLLKALTGADFDYRLTIVGDGAERLRLQTFAQDHSLVAEFMGSRPMAECQRIMARHDVLVLPSIHDGWGAVVNEAMSLGTWVVCSNSCGARQLILDSGFGSIFPRRDSGQLQSDLRSLSHDLLTVRAQRDMRRAWASQNITPVAVARRMHHSLCESFNLFPA